MRQAKCLVLAFILQKDSFFSLRRGQFSESAFAGRASELGLGFSAKSF